MFGFGGCGVRAQEVCAGRGMGLPQPSLDSEFIQALTLPKGTKKSDTEGTEVLLWAGSSPGADLLLPSQSSVWARYSLPQTMSI